MKLLWTVRLYQTESGFKVTIRDGVNRVVGTGITPDAAYRDAERHLSVQPWLRCRGTDRDMMEGEGCENLK